MDDVRERLEAEAELGSRVQELSGKVDHLSSGLNESNELRIKCQKRTRKMLDVLNLRVTTTNKQLKRPKEE